MARLRTFALAAGALAVAPRLLRRLRSQPGPPPGTPQSFDPSGVTQTNGGRPPAKDPLVDKESAAAAAEAGAIGGAGTVSLTGDPALDPVYEAGGGEAEGFEAAEAELIEAASHGDSIAEPISDAMPPEVESDLSTAVYGEADEIDPTEVVRDPDAGDDDPGEGPGIAADR